ncbi:MAG: hypothetical protein Q8N99_08265 [Nanoarchaeota archaeon]|nr:hypothetical protein [Nanoarchaeota archaeon]
MRLRNLAVFVLGGWVLFTALKTQESRESLQRDSKSTWNYAVQTAEYVKSKYGQSNSGPDKPNNPKDRSLWGLIFNEKENSDITPKSFSQETVPNPRDLTDGSKGPAENDFNRKYGYDSRVHSAIIDPEHAKIPHDTLIYQGSNAPGTVHHMYKDSMFGNK